MNVFEAIKTRRTVGVVKQDPVPRDVTERILQAAVWAPNHFRTEPWRFFVLEGDGRNKLATALVEAIKEDMEDVTTEENQKRIEKQQNNPFRAPLVIVVGVEPSNEPKVPLKEEYAAVSAAIQNMLLTAHASGLGAIWRTGDICYHPKIAQSFGLSEKGEVVGFLYMGYPVKEPKTVKKTDVSTYTKWFS